jgi:hypothetical protein
VGFESKGGIGVSGKQHRALLEFLFRRFLFCWLLLLISAPLSAASFRELSLVVRGGTILLAMAPQMLSDSLLRMIQSSLSSDAANAFRGMAPRFVALTGLTPAQRLLQMTCDLNTARMSSFAANALWRQAKHMIAMRRRREREALSDPETDSDEEERTCQICGRLGGDGNFFNLVRGGVMCDTCHDEDDEPPAIDSFF